MDTNAHYWRGAEEGPTGCLPRCDLLVTWGRSLKCLQIREQAGVCPSRGPLLLGEWVLPWRSHGEPHHGEPRRRLGSEIMTLAVQ